MIPENFKTWWEGTPDGQAAIAEAVKDGVTERKAVVHEIAELREALERDLPASLKGVESAAKKLAKAQQALRTVEVELQQAKGVVQNITARANAQIARLEQQLRDGAAPAVVEFLEATGDLWEKERREWSWSAPTHNGEKMPAKVRMEQLRDIKTRAERLMLEPDPKVVESELEPLRQTVADPLAAVA